MKAGPPAAATYLYAVVREPSPPEVGKAPAGPPGLGPLRAIDLGNGLWLAAADAPASRYEAASIERGLKDLEWVSACALAHERVVEHLAQAGTVVPMKLFTLFRSDARARAHVLRTRRRVESLLLRLAGRQEWGVRVTLDEKEARASARTRAGRVSPDLSAGARFLTMKKEQHTAVRRLTDRGRQEADGLYADLGRHADETPRRAPAGAPAGTRLLLDAMFLVPERRAERFQAAARRHAERLSRDGYRLVLTGPWPAYNFIAGER